MSSQSDVTKKETERGQLKIVSYNIHKGLATGNRRVVTDAIKKAIHALDPDLAFFQEVVGQNDTYKERFEDWPEQAQHDFLKSELLTHMSYGRNAVYPAGHHGNAIISRFPINFEINVNVSQFKYSNRGFLHTRLHPASSGKAVHAICVHLGLIEGERKAQTAALCEYIQKNLDPAEPLIVAGDFNDWRERISKVLESKILTKECFVEFYGSHARTFPSILPVSRLDRIYYRNLKLVSCERLTKEPWQKLSDHIPLVAHFNYLD